MSLNRRPRFEVLFTCKKSNQSLIHRVWAISQQAVMYFYFMCITKIRWVICESDKQRRDQQINTWRPSNFELMSWRVLTWDGAWAAKYPPHAPSFCELLPGNRIHSLWPPGCRELPLASGIKLLFAIRVKQFWQWMHSLVFSNELCRVC